MPETDVETVAKDWLQCELRSDSPNIIILDCRSTNEFQEGHIRSAVNFSIPSIMLRRLAAGKIDLTSTIKCCNLKQRIQDAYTDSIFILYNDSNSDLLNNTTNSDTINVLHRRLKQDGCRVFCLEDGFTSFRDAFPEWCEEYSTNADSQSHRGNGATDQLMGLRSLRISGPYSECSSSAESSDGESSAHPQLTEEPVEIIPGLYLGNAAHSSDWLSLQKYNIKYVLNVTPDLPNVFEGSGGISYLQIPVTDTVGANLAAHFSPAIKFIEEARTINSAVLVHCLAGVSRSVTVTLAYLMQTRSLCLNDAFNLVRYRKPDVSPNFHFLEQLVCFEADLRKANSTPQSAISEDSSYLTTDYEKCPKPTKYSCACSDLDCKCIQQGRTGTTPTTYLGIGISPDSGIEFDRWTPAGGTPK